MVFQSASELGGVGASASTETPPLVLSAIAATGRMPATMMAHTRSARNLVTKEFFKSMSSLTTDLSRILIFTYI